MKPVLLKLFLTRGILKGVVLGRFNANLSRELQKESENDCEHTCHGSAEKVSCVDGKCVCATREIFKINTFNSGEAEEIHCYECVAGTDATHDCSRTVGLLTVCNADTGCFFDVDGSKGEILSRGCLNNEEYRPDPACALRTRVCQRLETSARASMRCTCAVDKCNSMLAVLPFF
ncbi:unnamed protein product [Notodromas monacha]|uniref:Uncharacterized protein n=1 Tax=Notodromas monacha TaxID=399045 RepID=A0A7R9BLJ5_9CRUS|nr:unnamed protein product [Notodromas monacha]CAG0916392.1 unnamed protein product [Notodromas monacha]